MKTLCLILTFFLTAMASNAQVNHVMNGSFEDFTGCPIGMGELTKCIGWRPYHQGTTDYFRQCGGMLVSVPYNYAGYQPAADGKAYMGLVTYETSDQSYHN